MGRYFYNKVEDIGRTVLHCLNVASAKDVRTPVADLRGQISSYGTRQFLRYLDIS